MYNQQKSKHDDEPFFQGLVTFTTSGPIVLMVWKGNLTAARSLIGATRPWEAAVGTIRGDLGGSIPDNLVHCSDCEESAQRELELWFPPDPSKEEVLAFPVGSIFTS